MHLAGIQRRTRRAYGYWGALLILCLVLAGLQYRWAGEISRAEGARIKASLDAGAQRVGLDFHRELQASILALLVRDDALASKERLEAYAAKIRDFRAQHASPEPFRRFALILPQGEVPQLLIFDTGTGELVPSEWPSNWSGMKRQIEMRLSSDGGSPIPPALDPMVIEVPRFAFSARGQPGAFRGRMGEREWFAVELNPDYFAQDLVPRLLEQHFGAGFSDAYNVEVTVNGEPPRRLHSLSAGAGIDSPDASVPLAALDVGDLGRMLGRGGGPYGMGGMGRGRGGPRMMPADISRGRWQLRLQHRAGSLETLVERSRWRNLAVSGGILGLMLTAVFALVRASRRAEELAHMQMNFVAGISHELRTPLTVIRTAAFNLRGRVGAKPEQVERYGKLIQEESEKLTAMVEQVLRFASANSGQVIRQKEAVAVANLVDESLRGSSLALHGAEVKLEKSIETGIPPLLADEQAMRHVLQNLVDNALKYGMDEHNWLGISARSIEVQGAPWIEIEVADRGPGIPETEREKIFDPFFRGERAVADQIHGTGLGLNLAKKIVEAHGGEILVRSEAGQGTAFLVRLPAASAERQDEFAHSTG